MRVVTHHLKVVESTFRWQYIIIILYGEEKEVNIRDYDENSVIQTILLLNKSRIIMEVL